MYDYIGTLSQHTTEKHSSIIFTLLVKSSDMVSRWADDEEDAQAEAQRKQEREEKKRAKAEKARKQQEAATAAATAAAAQRQPQTQDDDDEDRPSKRRRLSTDAEEATETTRVRTLLRFKTPSWAPTRSIDNFERLNHIEEGSYGFVSRAKETATGDVVAIKKLKMDGSSQYGFPVTALREIQTLNAARGHRHIIELREVVAGDKLVGDQGEVFLVMDFLEHDLKTLMENMEEPFLPSEVKTLMLQLGSAIEWLHDRWILHVSLAFFSALISHPLTPSLARSQDLKHPHEQPRRNQTCRFWHGPLRRLAPSSKPHPPRRHTLVSISRTPPGRPDLRHCSRHVERRLHLWRAPDKCAPTSRQKRSRATEQGEWLTSSPTPSNEWPLQHSDHRLVAQNTDLRPLRHPHRSDLARLPSPPKRQISPPTTQSRPSESRRQDSRQVSLSDIFGHNTALLAARHESSQETIRKGSLGTSLFQRGPQTEEYRHVSDFPE